MSCSAWVFGGVTAFLLAALVAFFVFIGWCIHRETVHASLGHVKIHNVWVLAQDAPEFVKMIQRCESDMDRKELEK